MHVKHAVIIKYSLLKIRFSPVFEGAQNLQPIQSVFDFSSVVLENANHEEGFRTCHCPKGDESGNKIYFIEMNFFIFIRGYLIEHSNDSEKKLCRIIWLCN